MFLARIPQTGVDEPGANRILPQGANWIREDFIPAGLVEEIDGVFYRTEAAASARYELKRESIDGRFIAERGVQP